MSATETAITALERNWDMVGRSLDGLDDELSDGSFGIRRGLLTVSSMPGAKTSLRYGSRTVGTRSLVWETMVMKPAKAGLKNRWLLGRSRRKNCLWAIMKQSNLLPWGILDPFRSLIWSENSTYHPDLPLP